ncbi:hypothetical protein [Kiloniella sp. EL199]|uniref:hypothetical protein n=1 Tax=Kiloniella sp. EL199 TaxID=2107581 RepID=UPI000EA213CE|nr:hypothetical protein [Kiloniella sp. EL199]
MKRLIKKSFAAAIVPTILSLGAVSLVFLSPASAAQSSQEQVIEDVINEIERTVINRYFHKDDQTTQGHKKNKGKGKKKGLPPGLAKKGSLPPGLQKQLDEKGSLPPGLAKRDLPDDLQSRLPRRKNSKFVIVDDDVVLIDILTNKALDVLENVLKK